MYLRIVGKIAPTLLALATTSCLRSIAITPLPVHGEAPEAAAAQTLNAPYLHGTAPLNEDSTRYWSAFVHMETQDIIERWGIQWGDYVLISAQVKIPTRNAPIVRNLPLFLVEHGQVQTQSGVDLLKKIPISSHAREQVSITIEARYIKGSRYLEITKKILKEASRAAEPFLSAYPVASQILGTAIPMIDQILPANEKRTPSSRTMMIEPHNLGEGQQLLAFFLVPVQLPVAKAKNTGEGPDALDLNVKIKDESQEAKCERKSSRAIPKSLACAHLVECSDEPGMLCRAEEITSFKAKVDTAVGVIRTENPGPGAVRLWALEAQLAAIEERIRALQQPPPPLRPLGPPILDEFVSLQERPQPRTPARPSAELTQLLNERARLTTEIEQAKAALAAEGTTPEQRPASEKGEPGDAASTFLPYQIHRVRDAAYITVDFRSYDKVWEPLWMIRDARSECSAIDAGRVKSARDYLNANEDLFLARDVDLARMQFSLAELYLKMRSNVEKRDFGAVMTNLDELLSFHGRRSEFSPLPQFYCQDDDPLCEHYNAIYTCAENQLSTAPLQYAYRIWMLYHELRDENGARRDRCPVVATDEAFRLDLLDRGLSEFSFVTGEAYDYQGKRFKAASGAPLPIQVSGHVIQQLDAEARALLERQKATTFGPCRTATTALAQSRRVSLACADCWDKLAKACALDPSRLGQIRELRERAVDEKLALGASATCGE